MLASLQRWLFTLLLALAPAACIFAVDAPRAQSGIVGNQGYLWAIAPAKEGFQILYRAPNQGAELLLVNGSIGTPAVLANGSPAITSLGNTFYVAEQSKSGEVQIEELQVGSANEEGAIALARRSVVTLPKQAHVLAMAAVQDGLWLAVEAAPSVLLTQNKESLTAASKKEALAVALGLPPQALQNKTDEKQKEESKKEPAPELKLSDEVQLILLKVSGREVLPTFFPLLAKNAWLASDGKEVLFAPSAKALFGGSPSAMKAYECITPFTHLGFASNQAVAALLSLTHVNNGQAWADTLNSKWWVLRESKMIDAGECAMPIGVNEGYNIIEWEGRGALACVASTFEQGKWAVRLRTLDLKGKVSGILELGLKQDPQERRRPVLAGQFFLFLIALSIMIYSWTKGPKLFPHVPKGFERVGLIRRVLAGAIDMALVILPMVYVFHVPFIALRSQWPGFSMPTSLEDMRYVFIASGLFILHTLIGELLFGRSLGKALIGLQVVGLNGKPAAPWRIVLRGVLKILELLSPILLSVSFFSPFSQRLGDLAAGTAVVAKRNLGNGENNEQH